MNSVIKAMSALSPFALPSLRCPCWLFYITKEIICDTHVENGLHKILISFINPSLNSIRAYFGKHRFY